MKFISKINSIFSIKKTKDVEGAEVWVVSWKSTKSSCSGSYADFGDRKYKAFLFEDDAKEFALSLKDANDLLQNTTDINIVIRKQS